MEKIIGRFAFGTVVLLSCATFAGEVEEVHVYGSKPVSSGVDYSMPSGSDIANANNHTSYGGMSPRAAAERAAAEERGRRIGNCKSEEATRNHNALIVKNECIGKHAYNANAQRTQCPTVVQATTTATVTLDKKVINGTATASQVETPRDTCRQQIDDQLGLDKQKCSDDYDKSTPPMNCENIK